MNLQEARKIFDRLSITEICDANADVKILDSGLKSFCQNPKMLGKAFTVKSEGDLLPVIRGLQLAGEDHVLIIDSGGSPYALAGELFASEAKRKNMAGLIIDGFCRDTESVKQIGIPFYARGMCPRAGSKTKPGELNVPVSCGKVSISPGEIVIGDDNGIIVISMEELSATLNQALRISLKEEALLEKIRGGISLIELSNFEEHYQKCLEGEDSVFGWK